MNKKTVFKSLSFAAACAAFSFPQAYGQQVTYAPMGTPVVDGVIDAAYDATDWSTLDFDPHTIDDRWVSDTDLEARFKMLHDADGMYLLVDVVDSLVAVHRESGAWNDDALEVFFDMLNEDRDHDSLSGQIIFSAITDDVYAFGRTTLDPAGFTRASVITDGVGYVLEFFVPWSTWGVTVDDVTEIGFDLHVNDMDVSNPDATWASARRVWSDTNNNNFNTTAGFGTVILGDAPKMAYAPMGSPTVDGVIDGIWSATTWRSLEIDPHDNDPRWVSDTDLEAQFKMLHDAAGLYLLVDVVDSLVAVHRESGAWNDDALEVFFDMLNEDRDHDSLSGQIIFSAITDDVYAFGRTTLDPAGFTRASVITDGVGYVLEFFVPWSTWGVTLDDVTEIGFDLHVNDMDVSNPDATWASARRVWSDANNNNFNTTAGFGTVLLADDPDAGSGGMLWFGYEVMEGDFVDTGDWMGMVWIGNDPWVYVYDLAKYVYLPDDSGWVFLP